MLADVTFKSNYMRRGRITFNILPNTAESRLHALQVHVQRQHASNNAVVPLAPHYRTPHVAHRTRGHHVQRQQSAISCTAQASRFLIIRVIRARVCAKYVLMQVVHQTALRTKVVELSSPSLP